MFVETSAMVAILARETDASFFAERMASAATPVTGAHVIVESVMVIAARKNVEPREALRSIEGLLDQAGVDVLPITRATAHAAVDAFTRYGKGRGHPAQLNFGDCLSYATAKLHGMPMLFKGDDFALTDIERA